MNQTQKMTQHKNQPEEIEKLEDESTRILFQCRTIFPFTLFPDSISLTLTRVNIYYHVFFFSYSTFPILIEDLINVVVDTNILFGQVEFELRGFEQNPRIISFLNKSDAYRLKHLTTAVIESRRRGIVDQLSQLSQSELLETLEAIGAPEQPPELSV